MSVKWNDRTLITGPLITLATSEKQYNRAMKHCGVKKCDRDPWLASEHVYASCHLLQRHGEQLFIVTIRPQLKTLQEVVGLLIHESVHIWQHTRTFLGEDNPSPEFEAYAIQGICQSLIVAYQADVNG